MGVGNIAQKAPLCVYAKWCFLSLGRGDRVRKVWCVGWVVVENARLRGEDRMAGTAPDNAESYTKLELGRGSSRPRKLAPGAARAPGSSHARPPQKAVLRENGKFPKKKPQPESTGRRPRLSKCQMRSCHT